MRPKSAALAAAFAIPVVGVGAYVVTDEPEPATVTVITDPDPLPPCTLVDENTMMWDPTCDVDEPWPFVDQAGWLVCDDGAVGWLPEHRTIDGTPTALNDLGDRAGWTEPLPGELVDGVDFPLDEAMTIPDCDE